MRNILWTEGETCPILVFLYQQHLVHGSQIGGLARVVNAFTLTLKSSFHHPKKIQGSCQLWIQGNTFPCTTPLDPWLLWGCWPKKFPCTTKVYFCVVTPRKYRFSRPNDLLLAPPPLPPSYALLHCGWKIVSQFKPYWVRRIDNCFKFPLCNNPSSVLVTFFCSALQ